MTKKLSGKVALVTGGSRGIGAAIAKRLAAAGAGVAVTYSRGADAAASVVKEIERGGGKAIAIQADAADADAVRNAVGRTVSTLGRLDVLVNNAGLGGETPVVDMTDDEWDRVLNVTLTSVLRTTRAALRYFRAAEHGGVIVNNASVLGWRAQHSQSHYAAAKAGVMALTRCSAIEAVEYGVRINAVSPSIARHKFLDKTSSTELLDQLSAGEAFGRAAEPWEVASTIAFLASDYSSYLTGEVISVSSQHP
jgi:3-oxoacyl-[acyl-carrier protein] reductase